MVLAGLIEFVVFGIFNQFINIIALFFDNFFFFFSAHVVAEYLGNDLRVEDLFEFDDGVLVLETIVSEERVELIFMDGLNTIQCDFSVWSLNPLFFDLLEILFQVRNVD